MTPVTYAEMVVYLPCGCRVARGHHVAKGETTTLADASASLKVSVEMELVRHVCPEIPKES